MKKNGFLIVSLDFELLWGVFDVVDYQAKKTYFRNTHSVIPKILGLFEDSNIHATWAVVGMLLNKDWGEWEENMSMVQPSYLNKNLSAYHFAELARYRDTKEMCFAPELIDLIHSFSGQEIGTHTYSHYYTMEAGQTVLQFKRDLEKAIEVASRKNIELKSLVFPRNQLNKEYLRVCSELGIETVRSNPSDWYWKNPSSQSLIIKIFRTGEAYVPWSTGKSYPLKDLKSDKSLPLQQKASRFLRPHDKRNFMQRLKMKKVKSEMLAAARKGEIYHLWWHPHNFGEQPEQSLNDLAEILKHFEILREKYNFQSMNMLELSQHYKNSDKVKIS